MDFNPTYSFNKKISLTIQFGIICLFYHLYDLEDFLAERESHHSFSDWKLYKAASKKTPLSDYKSHQNPGIQQKNNTWKTS